MLLTLTPASAQGVRLQWQALGEPGNGGFIVSVAVSPHNPLLVISGGDMLGVARSTDGGESWGPTFGFDSWEMADITYHPTDPNIVWIGSMSGPYMSSDGGVNWVSRRGGMPPMDRWSYTVPIQKILYDPSNVNTLYAFGGSKRNWDARNGSPDWGAVWRSIDGGANWTRLGRVGSGARPGVMSVSFAADGTLYAVADGQPWRSIDGGASWQAHTGGLPTPYTATWIEPDRTAGGTLYLSTYARQVNGSWTPGGIYRTTDSGANWTALTTSGLGQQTQGENVTSAYHFVRVSPTGVLYTSDWAWNVAGIFKLMPGASSWQQLTGYDSLRPTTAMPAGPGAFMMAIDPANEQRLFTVNTEYLLRSTNGGTSWTDMSSRQPDQARPNLWRGRGFTGWVSVNFAINPFREQAGILAMDDGKYWFSEDNFATWQRGNLGNWGAGNDATFTGAGGNTIYMTTGQFGNNDGIWKSTDGGRNWARVSYPPNTAAEGWGIYAHPTTQQVWVVVGTRLYTSSNGGGAWSEVTSNGINGDGGLRWIASHPTQPLTFWVGGATGVWATTDGVSFTRMPNSPRDIHRIIADPTTPGRLYITRWRTGSGDGLYRYDSGAWTYLRDDFALANVAVHPQNPNYLAVITNDDPFYDDSVASGVWISQDGGTTWSQQNDGLPMLRGAVIRFNPWRPGQLIIGTAGRGYFVTQWDAAPNGATLNGTVTMQGRATAATVPLRVRVGSTDYTPTTDASGVFSLANLPAGGTSIRVKHAQSLAVAQAATLASGANTIPFGALRMGDVNDDNAVTLSDFSLLASSFNKASGQTGYDARADLNGDGAVTLADFSLLASNFNQVGG
jgi:photosystem II stability/assembly factor-like uncharacterized protein